MSEKLARNDIDNLGETRTARNRSVFRLQMQLWRCDSTRSGTIEANRSPKRRFRLLSEPTDTERDWQADQNHMDKKPLHQPPVLVRSRGMQS